MKYINFRFHWIPCCLPDYPNYLYYNVMGCLFVVPARSPLIQNRIFTTPMGPKEVIRLFSFCIFHSLYISVVNSSFSNLEYTGKIMGNLYFSQNEYFFQNVKMSIFLKILGKIQIVSQNFPMIFPSVDIIPVICIYLVKPYIRSN